MKRYRDVKIKTKLILSFAVAAALALIIEICSLFFLDDLNQIIQHNESTVSKPLAYANRITFDIGQVRVGLRDTALSTDKVETIRQYEALDEYLEDMHLQIDAYLETTQIWTENVSERDAVLLLKETADDWSEAVRSAIDLSSMGNSAAALQKLNNVIRPKDQVLNELLAELVRMNEAQAERGRVNAANTYGASLAILGALFLVAIILMAFFGMLTTRAINRPVKRIVTAAEMFAGGNTKIDLRDFSSDEMGQIGRALKRVADKITELISDNNRVFEAVQAGHLKARVDEGDYKGSYHMVVDGFNRVIQMLCGHLDALPDAVAFFDLEGQLVYGNAAMDAYIAHFTGYAASAALARIFTSGESDVVPEPVANALLGKTDTFSAIVAAEGRIYGAALRSVKRIGGTALCGMLTLTDLSETMRLKGEAERANRAKTEFLSHMSHEIRTPMNAIIGMTQIARRTEDPEKIRDCINKIESSSHHLLGVLNDVLDMSKIEAGKLSLAPEATKLSEDLKFVLSMMQSRAKERDIAITVDTDIKHDDVMVDNLRLNQVMINLISNAIKFSPDNSTIVLRARELESDGEWTTYRFTVADQGIGMSPEQVARLFRSFEQADVNITKRYGGTGLGLSISKSIVEMMNGQIWVESELDKGSKFIFTVQLKTLLSGEAAQMNAAQGGERPSAQFDFSKLRALVTDDVDINRLIISELFSETGLQIEEASNGQEAVNLFANSPPGHFDLVLMDMQMPVLDGCEATRAIRALSRADAKSVVIIAMTANVMKDDVDMALSAGMDGHIGKPIDYETAAETIKRLCREK